VVRISPATEAPFCRAERTTRSGSITPISTMSPKRPSSGVEALVDAERADLLDDVGAVVAGVARDEVHRLGERGAHDLDADPVVAGHVRASSADSACSSAAPPPATMPSAIAARVACSESSTRCRISLSSALVGAPTEMIAALPDSRAMRSLSQSSSVPMLARCISARSWLSRTSTCSRGARRR
jgi:hypothetical protein